MLRYAIVLIMGNSYLDRWRDAFWYLGIRVFKHLL